MLKIENVSYKYGQNNWLFRHLNLSINRGEIVGMYGRSGTGKTTLAQLITSYLKPTEGSVSVGDHLHFGNINPVQLIWQHPEKTINPNWQLIKVLQEAGDLAPKLIDNLGIRKDWLHRYPHELSGGELQRFCIARALGSSTRFIVADEITSMFDAITQAQIWNAFLKVAKASNIGVLVISHDIHLLQQVSDRIINFNDISHPYLTETFPVCLEASRA